MQSMSFRERLMLVITVSVVMITIPMVTLAATGQLVNITDPTNAGRQAVVADGGALQVQSRPGAPGAIHLGTSRTGPGWMLLKTYASAPGPLRVASILIATESAGTIRVRLMVYAIPKSSACTDPAMGNSATYKTLVLKGPGTVEVDFGSIPVKVNVTNGVDQFCLGLMINGPADAVVYGSISGYIAN